MTSAAKQSPEVFPMILIRYARDGSIREPIVLEDVAAFSNLAVRLLIKFQQEKNLRFEITSQAGETLYAAIGKTSKINLLHSHGIYL